MLLVTSDEGGWRAERVPIGGLRMDSGELVAHNRSHPEVGDIPRTGEPRPDARAMPTRAQPSSTSFTTVASCFSENGFGRKPNLASAGRFLAKASSA